jgi:hypothetical protein
VIVEDVAVDVVAVVDVAVDVAVAPVASPRNGFPSPSSAAL